MVGSAQWQRCKTNMFWGDIAHDDHVVQIYDEEVMLVDTLSEFASDGFDRGDSVIIIATDSHLDTLKANLLGRGYPVHVLEASDRYIPLNADRILSTFMVNGEPNEEYFMKTISEITQIARQSGQNVRAFGEMVVLLWQRGNSSATLQLEHLWNKFCTSETLCLFCAYPGSDFKQDAGASVMHICTAHSKIIRSDKSFPSEIQYKNVVQTKYDLLSS